MTIAQYISMGRTRARVTANRLALRLVPAVRPLDGDRAVSQLASADGVLVLCAGNICRSPMAERYLRTQIRERDLAEFSVTSAGFVPIENRSSPETAVRAAREYGVELADHESTTVTPEMLSGADVILVMDVYNYVSLKRRFDGVLEETYFLKAVGIDGMEIPDPHGTDLETFRRVYGEITGAIDETVRRIREEET